MISIEEQKQLAIAFVTHIANGGIDEKYIADDMVAWSLSSGDMPKATYWPRLKHVKAIFTAPLQMTIERVTAVQDRVFLEALASGAASAPGTATPSLAAARWSAAADLRSAAR